MAEGPKIQCIHCKDIIQSKHRHDFQPCSCGRIFIDGGPMYTRIGFKEVGDYVPIEVEDAEQE